MTKKIFAVFLITLGIIHSIQTVLAEAADLEKLTEQAYNELINSYSEGSDCIKVIRMGRWKDLSQNSLIIYAPSKNRPYYVLLRAHSPDISMMKTLNVRAGRTRFCGKSGDELVIDGRRHKIQAIKALDRDTAKKLINFHKDKKRQSKQK